VKKKKKICLLSSQAEMKLQHLNKQEHKRHGKRKKKETKREREMGLERNKEREGFQRGRPAGVCNGHKTQSCTTRIAPKSWLQKDKLTPAEYVADPQGLIRALRRLWGRADARPIASVARARQQSRQHQHHQIRLAHAQGLLQMLPPCLQHS
jgi:hypothetical protein